MMAVTQPRPSSSTASKVDPRAFVRVQDGCDHRCTFCIIPYGRGNSRSVPMGQVVEEVRQLVRAAAIGRWCSPASISPAMAPAFQALPSLGMLVKQILKHIPALRRLRLSSINSIETDRDLLDALANDE